MKKKHFILLLFLITGQMLFAQKNADSLKKLLSSLSYSEKYPVLIDLSRELLYTNAEESFNYASTALGIAVSLQDEDKMAESDFFMGASKYRLGILPDAIRYLNRAVEYNKKVNNKKREAAAKNYLGIINTDLKRYDVALEIYNELLAYYENNNQPFDYCLILNNVGTILIDTKKFDEALNYYTRILKILNDIKSRNTDFLATVYANIGECYYWKGEYNEALNYRKKSLDLFIQIKLTDGIANLQSDIGSTLMKLKDYKSAEIYLNDALENYNVINYKAGIRNTKATIADLFKETRQLGKSFEVLKDLEKMCIADNDSSKLGECYKSYSEIYALTGNQKLAYSYLLKSNEIKSAFELRFNNEKLNELKAIFVTNEKEYENNALRHENDLQKEKISSARKIMTAISIGLVLISILLFLVIRNEMKIKRINKEIGDKNKKLEELNVAKDKFISILAHNLKNPFWAIIGQNKLLEDSYDELTDEDRKELICRIGSSAEGVYKLFEDLLSWARAQLNSIALAKEEMKISDVIQASIKPYLTSAQNKNINIVLKVESESTVCADKFMIETVLGNLFDNAIKFSNKNGEIVIDSGRNNGNVEISIKDFGAGMDQFKMDKLFKISENVSSAGTMNEKGTGLGLIICKEFIEKHNGSIKVESSLGMGTKFTVSLPA